MASVDKLSIRGVRSFSPDRECVIKFYKPLTVIYGMNGCGKTTIIECLKYSCTGSLPPGSKSGQSFVHDPKLADLSEVKAQIKLRFQNRAGIPTTVIRSLQLTQLKKSMRFKALDSVVQTIHKGQKHSLTQRCAEVDNMIPQLMGVKKAVLDNVIFCHQEDSNWPLQEGTALKKKFDDIFESTRYTKALKVISDERKKQRNQMKDLERDLSLIKARAETVQTLVRERDECKEKREEIGEKIKRYETVVNDSEKQLEELQSELEKVRELESEDIRLKTLVRNAEREVKEALKAREKTDHPNGFEATIEELESQRDNVLGGDEEQERETRDLKKKIKEFEKQMQSLRKKSGKLIEKQGRLRAKLESSRDMEDRLDASIQDLASKYCIAVPSQQQGTQSQQGSMTLQAANTFKQRLQTMFASKDAQLKERQKQCEQELSTLREEMNKTKVECMRLDSLIQTHTKTEKECRTARKKMENSSDRLRNSVSGSDERLKELDRTIETLEETQKNGKYEEEMKTLNDLIVQCDRELASLEFESKRLEQERDRADQHNTALEQVKLLRKRLVQCEETERDLKERLLAKGFETVIGHPFEISSVEDDFREALKTVQSNEVDKREDNEEMKQKIAVAKSEARAASKVLAEVEREKRTFLREVGVFDSIISSMDLLQSCENLNDALSVLNDKEKELNGLLTTFQSGVQVSEFLEVKSKQDKCCVACGRNMTAKDIRNMEVALSKLREMLEQTQKKEEYEEELEELSEVRARLEPLRAPFEALELLEKKKLPDARKNQEKKAAVLKNLESMLHDREEILEEAIRKVQDVERFRDDVTSLHVATEQKNEAQETLKIEEERFNGSSNTQRTKREISEELNKINSKKKSLQQTREEHHVKIRQLRDEEHLNKKKLLEHKSERVELHKCVKELRDTLEQISKLSISIEEANTEKQKSKVSLKEMNKTLHNLKNDHAAKKRALDGSVSDLRDELNRVRSDLHVFNEVLESLGEVLKEDTASELERLHVVVKSNEEEQSKLKENIENLNPKLASLMEGLNRAKLIAVAISADIRVIKAQDALSKIEKKREEWREKMDEVRTSTRNTRKDIDSVSKTRDDAFGKIHRIRGQMKELKRREQDCDVKLNTREFKKVKEQYRKTVIDVETAQMAVDDLEKYYKAVDKALMTYHTTQIKKINIIIAQLWSLTYKGGDIEKISIMSDVAGRGIEAKGRNFNYRLVMSKGDQELDMKGRVSAGQRVLSSLVIRLALADVFCENCGILTLDEPTTNLDEKNKRGLAEALCKIIEERHRQRNFQLVVITHDETFVDALSEQQSTLRDGILRPEYYYIVSREQEENENGEGTGRYYSKITRQDWD